jgi:hypothetical protein
MQGGQASIDKLIADAAQQRKTTMTDTAKPAPQRHCRTCKTHPVRPHQDECPNCRALWYQDWARRVNKEIEEIRILISKKNME